jgi:alpha-glucosidase
MNEKLYRETVSSRRTFISAALAGSPSSQTMSTRDEVRLAGPNGAVQFHLSVSEHSRLEYEVRFKNRPVIEMSRLGIILDNVDLGREVTVGEARTYRVKERYASRGVHSEATNHFNGVSLSIKHRKSGTTFTLDVRAFNDGIAFRYIVPGEHKPKVVDEATAFAIPAGSTVWLHDFDGHYEGIHNKKDVSDLLDGDWAAPPVTIKLANGVGYASITEGALVNFAGMGLQADGHRGLRVRLGHSMPVSYPFRLRYGADEGERLAVPAAIAGTISSPWRVIMIGSDLNTLVNCDIVNSVSPPPDKTLFPSGLDTDWVKPGRAVWRYLDGGESTFEGIKEFSRLAGQLGFEYNVVEGLWQRWTESQMRELVEYSRQQRVGIWFWKHSRDLRTADSRRNFFRLCRELGVVGAKIDFFDHEAKEVIDLYQDLLRNAAEHRIMVNFHGANKPAGEARTWPNELTRESIRGLEYRSAQTRSTHNTTLPFTRMLAGHADYTPVHFGERRRETSWAHQIASAAIFTSPLLIYGAHPKSLLENPAVEIIKAIPAIWDETITLEASEIGEIVGFARRRGEIWFLAIMNGLTAKTVTIPLAFLMGGKYQALVGRDDDRSAAAVRMDNMNVTRRESLPVELRAGGGFIARFSR